MKSVENTYKTYENQTWEDISNDLFGKVDYAFDLALLNESSVTSIIPAGTIIRYNSYIKEEFVLKSMSGLPATAVIVEEVQQQEGIGYWKIGVNFKVS